MSVLERTQEIVMLRNLGMTRRQVGKTILAEAGVEKCKNSEEG